MGAWGHHSDENDTVYDMVYDFERDGKVIKNSLVSKWNHSDFEKLLFDYSIVFDLSSEIYGGCFTYKSKNGNFFNNGYWNILGFCVYVARDYKKLDQFPKHLPNNYPEYYRKFALASIAMIFNEEKFNYSQGIYDAIIEEKELFINGDNTQRKYYEQLVSETMSNGLNTELLKDIKDETNSVKQ